jgi:predicted DNA-binding transcriptional regulator AlpA
MDNISPLRESRNLREIQLDALLNEHDVSRITGLSLASVRRWRLLRKGPKFIKISASVRYRASDVAAWLESMPTGGGNLGAKNNLCPSKLGSE